ncbi:hypothetical protein [Parvibaculum sp.]|jgi:hypothetical protein|uniref:hypothetical protein n=1 Tax=Parvibaculum sp. TaxID=2024848 RepID=UPI003918CE1F
MISITQNLETPAFSALVDPECASLLRQNDLTPPPATETKLAWQVAPSRGAVKDRLLKDDTVRLVLIAIEEEADPLLRDLARNIGQIRGRAWLHAVLVTRDRVTPPLLAQLRNFASWSVLALPCSADELSEILLEASAKAADQHRLAMLSTAIRAEAEDLLVRTRNIVGAAECQHARRSGQSGQHRGPPERRTFIGGGIPARLATGPGTACTRATAQLPGHGC